MERIWLHVSGKQYFRSWCYTKLFANGIQKVGRTKIAMCGYYTGRWSWFLKNLCGQRFLMRFPAAAVCRDNFTGSFIQTPNQSTFGSRLFFLLVPPGVGFICISNT